MPYFKSNSSAPNEAVQRPHRHPGVDPGRVPRCVVDPRVERIKATVTAHMHRKMTLGEMARQVGLSVSRMSHLFKAHIGVGPSRYLKDLRMERARALLETTSLSVKEITARVGFCDISHFVRDFKRSYGVSPIRYRIRFLSRLSKVGIHTPLEVGEPPTSARTANN